MIDQKKIEKAVEVRRKILAKVQEKYLFTIQYKRQAVDKQLTGDCLSAVVFREVEEHGGRFTEIPGSDETIKTSLLISAIGSIPEPIPGIPLNGEIYDVIDTETGKLRHFENVFALGNAVTGRGNIRQSQIHGRMVSENIVDQYLAWQQADYQVRL